MRTQRNERGQDRFSIKLNSNRASFTYTRFDNSGTDFTDIQGIIVSAAAVGVRVDERRIFPSLGKAPVVEEDIALLELMVINNKREK